MKVYYGNITLQRALTTLTTWKTATNVNTSVSITNKPNTVEWHQNWACAVTKKWCHTVHRNEFSTWGIINTDVHSNKQAKNQVPYKVSQPSILYSSCGLCG